MKNTMTNKTHEKKNKKYSAKRYPLYSIQLHYDRNKTLCITETSNIPDGTEPFLNESVNMFYFGRHLAKSDLLTKGDKLADSDDFYGFSSLDDERLERIIKNEYAQYGIRAKKRFMRRAVKSFFAVLILLVVFAGIHYVQGRCMEMNGNNVNLCD